MSAEPQEVLALADAMQTDELCPCNWSKGDEVIDCRKAVKLALAELKFSACRAR